MVHDRSRRPRRAAAVATGVVLATSVVGAALTVRHVGVHRIAGAVLSADPTWLGIALALMCLAMASRAVSWRAILSAALPRARVGLAGVLRATSIGVLLSATAPGRVGEAARAMVIARRLPAAAADGPVLPVVLGTIVSQTVLNVGALLVLGVLALARPVGGGWGGTLPLTVLAPGLVIVLVLALPAALSRLARGHRWRIVSRVHAAALRLRAGLAVFRSPRPALAAIGAQSGAWALQWLSCYALLVAFGLAHHDGLRAAAAVLFAVNVTAAVPVTPSNVGVFQAACVAVLSAAYAVAPAEALGYGVVLQIVEVATAVLMGAPALVREGMGPRLARSGPSGVL